MFRVVFPYWHLVSLPSWLICKKCLRTWFAWQQEMIDVWPHKCFAWHRQTNDRKQINKKLLQQPWTWLERELIISYRSSISTCCLWSRRLKESKDLRSREKTLRVPLLSSDSACACLKSSNAEKKRKLKAKQNASERRSETFRSWSRRGFSIFSFTVEQLPVTNVFVKVKKI